MGIHDIPKTELIERAAKELQKDATFQPPAWAAFAKTGAFKQHQPVRDDWWFVRAAAILRRIAAAKGPIGVQKLRTLYGGKKNRGQAPERFYKGSGSIIRKILQQLDKAGFTKRIDKGLRKGRAITPHGLSFLGKIANAYMKEHNIVLPKKPEGELHMTELPKEKPAKKPRVRKKPAAVAPAPAEGAAPAAPAPSAAAVLAAPAAGKPKKPRAPRKKKEAAPAGAAPAPAPAPAPEERPADPAATPTDEPPANA